MKLNKTEREALVRKIEEQIKGTLEKKNQEKIDQYVPSNEYQKVSDYFDQIVEVMPELGSMLAKLTTTRLSDRFSDWPFIKESWLAKVRDKELGIKIPNIPYSLLKKVEDDLILQGIDSNSSIETIIQNLVDKYIKLL